MIDHHIEVDGVIVMFTSKPRKEAIIKIGEKRITLDDKEWHNLRSILALIEYKSRKTIFGV